MFLVLFNVIPSHCNLGNRKNSHSIISGEYGACGTVFIEFKLICALVVLCFFRKKSTFSDRLKKQCAISPNDPLNLLKKIQIIFKNLMNVSNC